jgi:hypothetical protein
MPELSKYAENQFLNATISSVSLTSEIIADCKPRLAFAVTQDASFAGINGEFISSSTAWEAAETVATNCEAALKSATMALDEKLTSLTRKPDADTNSLIETWDTTIRAAVAYQGTTYTLLLPDGRETITRGTIEAQLDAIRDFGVRLSAQAGKPTLIALGTTVTTFSTAARALRTAQTTCKTRLDDSRQDLEALRIINCQVLYAMVGIGMNAYRTTPEKVDDLFSIGLLRGSILTAPLAPTDTTVVVATRTVSTTAMPAHATRLEGYRQAPGGAPELIAIGEPGQLSIVIENLYTFTEGVPYQIWLQARNSRGTSPAGPVQEWLEE